MRNGERGKFHHPNEAASHDPAVLRAALLRESIERRRAECRANMQTEVVKLALDLLVREPDIEGFFGGLTQDDGRGEREQHLRGVAARRQSTSGASCGWPTSRIGCLRRQGARVPCDERRCAGRSFPCESDGARTCSSTRRAGIRRSSTRLTIARLPESDSRVRPSRWSGAACRDAARLGERMLGWMTVCSHAGPGTARVSGGVSCSIEAIARQAALALHHSRLVEQQPRRGAAQGASSRSATASRATFTTTSRRGSRRS